MNIQIFGKAKCFDTKKAERYFKERRVKFQRIDLLEKGLSRGEFASVKAAAGFDALVDSKAPGVEILTYLAYEADKEEKLLENPAFFKTPIVRNGKKATVGFCPDVWKLWEQE
ncbi:MAG: ArsC family transcriptional regulator [Oscillospiraceae bacterium]|nr:ArsC family transcriptional regulator [Oscillospiraceae bacterium]